MRSDRGRERVRQDDDRVERVGWLDGEEFAKLRGLGRLEGIVG